MQNSGIKYREARAVDSHDGSTVRVMSAIIQNVKCTRYFNAMRQRSDRSSIRLEWIERVINNPVKETVQKDGRIRRWAPIKEADGKYLRVVLLSDGETAHNAFFDRSFVL